MLTFGLSILRYSSNQEISRARTSFFKGSKSLLLITERFHFYRRYRLRGAKTYVFYQLPDHAVFYPELVSFAFLAKGGRPGAGAGGGGGGGEEEMDVGGEVEVDEGEVSTRVMFSKWDWMKLERVVGTEDARKMVAVGAESVFTFV
jgi:U3 small nucleolar RNA-associated protein 25